MTVRDARDCATTTAECSDDHLEALSRRGDAWALVRAAHERWRLAPGDPAARVYTALGACMIGVPRLALDALGDLQDPDATALRDAAAALEPAELSPEELIRTCRDNLDAIAPGGRAELVPALDAWSSRVRSGELSLHAAQGRNIVIRKQSTGGLRWLSLTDARRAAQETDLGFAGVSPTSTVNDLPGMLTVGSFRTPWLLARVLEAVRGGAGGYTPRVLVADTIGPEDALCALAMRPMAVLIGRVRWFVGAEAPEQLSDELRSCWEWALPRTVLMPAGVPGNEAVAAALSSARVDQESRLEVLSRENTTAGRSPDEWRSRFDEALGGGKPLRVLLPVTRYSSYLRHAARDLAGAIERAGHHATVLEEPEPDLKPAATYEQQAHRERRPDLTIMSNWPRATRPGAWPAGAPAVCWVQDMLPHLFDRALADQQSELDFMVGLVDGSLVRDWGYPLGRAVFLTTPACPVKFHAGPVTFAQRERYTADVAYVSHQSAPPEVLLERMLERARSGEERRVVRAVAADIEHRFGTDEPLSVWEGTYQSLEAMTAGHLRDVLGESAASPEQISHALHTLTLPLAERTHRHTSLRWAQRVCAERGLSLAVYGRGWERTALAAHARGEVAHADDLRACYKLAGCHLHASLSSNAHQRVFECALSGGFMLRRGPSPDAPVLTQSARQSLVQRPHEVTRRGYAGYLLDRSIARRAPDDPRHDVIRLNSVLERGMPGLFEHEGLPRRAEWLDAEETRLCARWQPQVRRSQYPDWSYDNAAQTRFRTPGELGMLIADAASRPGWRGHAIEHHAVRARAFNTTDAFWAMLVGSLRERLGVE